MQKKFNLTFELREDNSWFVTSDYPRYLHFVGHGSLENTIKDMEYIIGYLLLFNHENRVLAEALMGKEKLEELEPSFQDNKKMRAEIKDLIRNFPGNSEQLIIALNTLEEKVEDEVSKQTIDRACRVIAILAKSSELTDYVLDKEE